MPKKKPRETQLWNVDPSVFEPIRKAGFFERHIQGRARSLGKHTLYLLAFAYPLLLVIGGVAFGGIFFWPALAASMGIIWLIIKRAGYSGNFASWDIGYRKFVGLFGAFGIALGIVYGLIYIGVVTVLIFGGVLLLVLVLGIMRSSIDGSGILQLFEGRLNKLSGLGIGMLLGSVTIQILVRNTSTVLVHNPTLTLSVLDIEYLTLYTGAIAGFAGVIMTMKPPRKATVGSAVWVSLFLYLITIPSLTAWNQNALPTVISSSLYAFEALAFLSSLILMIWGFQERRRISRAKPSLS